MMLIKSSSTGKSKVKRSQLIRFTECSTCPKSLSSNMHKKDYERPQPVKIAQLLGNSENVKPTQRNSARKKLQPERLGTFSTTKSTKLSGKQNAGTSTSVCSIHSNNHVRRILNFNGLSVNTVKDNHDNKNQLNKTVTDEPIHKKVSTATKRSLLLPPNSIKDKHLQKYCIENVNRCSKISEVSKEMEETNTDVTEKENEIMNHSISFNSRETCNKQKTSESSNYLKSKFVDTDHTHQSKIVTPKLLTYSQYRTTQKEIVNNEVQSNVSGEISINLKESGNCIQNLCNGLQDTKLLISENNMDMECEKSEIIYVSKDKIIRLERDLKDLLKEAEKNIIKLKSTLTYITRLLSANDTKIIFDDTESREEKITMIDKEIQVEPCKLLQYSEQLKTPITCIPQIRVTNIQQDDEDNKENKSLNIRRISDITTDGSFLELENQLNIAHTKPTQNYTVQPKTPIITMYKQKRSFREYMTLKSSISFLETPDGKKFRSLCQIDDTDKSALNVRYISNKLLTDLHHLYSESPESEL